MKKSNLYRMLDIALLENSDLKLRSENFFTLREAVAQYQRKIKTQEEELITLATRNAQLAANLAHLKSVSPRREGLYSTRRSD